MASDDLNTRLREPPRQRFADTARFVSLAEAFEELPDESTGLQGHMQKAVYRHGRVTTAIMELQAGSTIREHHLDGEAIFHVLDGRLTISAGSGTYTLNEDDVLLLDPGVAYTIEAEEPTRMLMHVVLERRA